MLVGCTSYQYEISTPNGPSRSITKDEETIIPANPAELRLRQVDSRCVLLIGNSSKELLSLQPAGCAIVDPAGQSRAIAARVIPPGSHLKLVLPPIREVEPRGPVFGIGVGMQVDASSIDQPREAQYLSSGNDSQEYWEWNGAGTIKLFLSIKQNESETKHEFVITRRKE